MLHGDGARFTEKNSNTLLTVSWKSLLVGNFDKGIIPAFSLPKAIRVPKDSGVEDPGLTLWRWCAHFFGGLFRGRHVELDPD
eukprot:1631548-Alexandrium_andersonii.AAC.1